MGTIDVMMGGLPPFRVLAVYMPDGFRPISEVGLLLLQLDEIIREARTARRRILVACDFNAQVGQKGEHDLGKITGGHGFGQRTMCGELLLQWCSLHELVVSNSLFDHGARRSWTYCKGEIRRQFEYVLVDTSISKYRMSAA